MNSSSALRARFLFALFTSIVFYALPAEAENGETLILEGLAEPVRILRDPWGISHIYAANQPDLFFAQGFSVARDRIFQLELWRRQATGTMAEILGSKALAADRGARLLRARVDMHEEMRHYHPEGEEIITSFVRGINAYVELTEREPDRLPIEFELLGLRPGRWTPEVVVSRHNGLYRNVGTEIRYARAIDTSDPETVRGLLDLHPGNPELQAAEGLDLSLIDNEILALYNARRRAPRFEPEDIVLAEHRAESGDPEAASVSSDPDDLDATHLGSNNWVLAPERTFSRRPIMANDPHRGFQAPSLRYFAHLVAPGWNVIGGGEPSLPGLSIGHNEFGAWGLTIFAIDQEDLYVYDTDPQNPNRYRYLDGWEEMELESATFDIKGEEAQTHELKYTRHGPVLHEDSENHKAYALRAAWLEVGGAPYLASLRMDQARNVQEFLEACGYSHTPSENMVWADVEGNILWQAVGLAPLRPGWNGLLPVPGDGSREWGGFLPIRRLPHLVNPPEGHFASANQDNIPRGYPFLLGLRWTDPYRFSRIEEVLAERRRWTMADMMRLQTDELSIPARTLVPLLAGLEASEEAIARAAGMLLDWDYVLGRDSAEAAIYAAWERALVARVRKLKVPESLRGVVPNPSLKRIIDWVLAPDGDFGGEPLAARDALLLEALGAAIEELTERQGPDPADWRYGREEFHHILIRHPLGRAVNEAMRARLEVGPYPRGGNGYTVNNTAGYGAQRSGASLRMIVDVGEWDLSVGANTPGQSGRPTNPHYRDLFKPWADGKFFPLLYSPEKVQAAAQNVTRLEPAHR